MAMDMSEIKRRMEALSDSWAPSNLMAELYGIASYDARLTDAIVSWGRRFQIKPEDITNGTAINRHYLELFFQKTKILPLKLAAARLGMNEDSLTNVATRLEINRNDLDISISPQEGYINDLFIRDIRTFFTSLRSTIFYSHSDMCDQLHQAISEELDIKVDPVFCVTSKVLNPDSPDYAFEYDAVTGDPIGLRYQMWLSTGKPISLRPDACSWITYFKHYEVLGDYLLAKMGPNATDEEIALIRSAV